jgi:hypothetical protein
MSGDRSDTLSTYRHLRLAIVLLLLLLLVSVGLRAISASPGVCFEGSISAYYFTSARAVFVVALCAIGTCLIVYRGNRDAEDIALNASGALAFVVAFVPTKVPQATDVTCSASNVPGPGQLEDAVNNNVVALIIVSFVAILLATILVIRMRARAGEAPGPGEPGSSGPGDARLLALGVFLAVLVLGTLAFAMWPDGFRDNAHNVAAFGTFVGLLAVVIINAIDTSAADRRRVAYRNLYVVIAGVMVASLVVLGLLHLVVLKDWRHGVLWIEATLLVEILVFWVVQTFELWDETRRDAPPRPT